MAVRGSIDLCDGKVVEGWVYAEETPLHRFTLQVLAGETVLGTCTADRYREDLAAAGIGAGTVAFRFSVPDFVSVDPATMRLRLVGSDVFVLPSGAAGAAAAAPTAAAAMTPSRFGGLWFDRGDWIDVLGAKHRNGEIDDETSELLFRFARDGYVVLRGAVDEATLATINAAVDRAWDQPPEGLLIETFEPDDAMHYVPPAAAFRYGRTKMLDLYAYDAVVRQAIANGPAMRFLAAVFGETPKAFQSLYFETGSQQAMHKDTAYVKIDANPLALAATWLALEDIAPETGELEYYVGSHRAPDFLFGGTSKWMEAAPGDHPRFLQSLHDDAVTYGHTRSRFLARAGDVLVWHADLAHGGSAVKGAAGASGANARPSRRSLVTHFTGASFQPFYRRASAHPELATPSCIFVSQYGPVGG
jgi:hypothetical protein